MCRRSCAFDAKPAVDGDPNRDMNCFVQCALSVMKSGGMNLKRCMHADGVDSGSQQIKCALSAGKSMVGMNLMCWDLNVRHSMHADGWLFGGLLSSAIGWEISDGGDEAQALSSEYLLFNSRRRQHLLWKVAIQPKPLECLEMAIYCVG